MITSTAQKDQVDISVGGGTKKLKYFINTGYYNEKLAFILALNFKYLLNLISKNWKKLAL